MMLYPQDTNIYIYVYIKIIIKNFNNLSFITAFVTFKFSIFIDFL